MNVRGGEISDSGNDDDQHKIKGDYCNGGVAPHEKYSVGGGEIAGGDGFGDVGGDSGASDLVVVEKVEGKALGESDVAVSRAAAEAGCECEEAVNNKNENDCEEKTEISRRTIPVGGDVQNDEGSVVVSDVSGDNKKDVTDANEIIHDRELSVQNGAENEVRDGVDGVNVADANGIHQNGEIRGDEKKDDAVTVVEGDDADANNGGYSELEDSVAVENCVVNKGESEIPVAVGGVSATTDVKECGDEDGQGESAEKAQIESVDSGGGGEMEDGGNVVEEGTSEAVSDAVSDEKPVVEEVTDREFQNVVIGDVQNGSADTEKDEVPIGVDGVPAATDVKESAGEDVQISLDVEEAKVETVPESDHVDECVVDADVQNSSAEPELSNEITVKGEAGCNLEKPEEESGEELVSEGEDSSALDSSNMAGDGNVVSDVNDNVVESEAEPSNIAVDSVAESSSDAPESEAEPSSVALEREAEPSNIAVEREAEPSNIAVESEAGEPANIAVESEAAEPSNIVAENEAAESSNIAAENEAAESSNIAAENEAEPSNIAVKQEAEPSNIAVKQEAEHSITAVGSEAEPSITAVESEAEPSNLVVVSEAEPSIIAVESEAEPSAEGELSVEREGGSCGDEETKPTEEGSSADALDGQNMGSEVVKRPFYYLIRLPRYDDDENIKDQIKIAFHQVEEKTRIRDAIRAESQTKKVSNQHSKSYVIFYG